MDNRFLTALLLSAVVLFLWFGVVVPLAYPPKPIPPPGEEPVPEGGEEPGKVPPGASEKGGAEKGAPGAEPGEKPEEKPEEKPGEGPEAPVAEATKVKVLPDEEIDGRDFRLVLSNEGAALKRLVLKEGFLDPSQTEAYPLLQEIQEGVRSFLFDVDGGREDLTVVNWEPVPSSDPNRAEFRFLTSEALEVRKIFSCAPDLCPRPYTFHIRVTVKNLGEKTRTVPARLFGPAGIPAERQDYPNILAYVALGLNPEDPTVKEFDPGDVAEEAQNVLISRFHYAGVGNKYFGAVVFHPEADGVTEVEVRSLQDTASLQRILLREKDLAKALRRASTNLQPVLRLKEVTIEAGEALEWEFTVFAGPKRDVYLDDLGIRGIRTSVSSFCLPGSWTRGLSWIMLKILIFFDGIFSNYGVAILLLTMLVRAMMFPLSIRMQISMNEYQKKMKKVQPKMKEIKERYKDKQRQQQEMAKLMREHGVSLLPIKGCLPIFLQFPIFIALFVTLRNSLELRHAGFLYITDLAAPDRLFAFPSFVTSIPLLGPMLGPFFNLLPVLWIGMMILQQRLAPQTATDDPQMKSQKKMMLIMSIVFGFLFFRIESGCALYIMASTLWGMGESYLIRRRLAKQEEA